MRDARQAASQAAADEARYQDVLAQRQAAQAEELRRLSVDIQSEAAGRDEAERESFLERTFGKLEEFDAYAAGFGVLKSAVTDGFQAWISGAESVGTAVRRSIAQSLGGYAVEMAGMALVSAAHGIYHLTNPLTAAQGAGELFAAAKYAAAATALGVMAKTVAPSGGGAGASSGASAGGSSSRRRSQDHRGRGDGPGGYSPTASTVVIVNDTFTDSQRQRERSVYAAIARTQTVYRPPVGVSS
ncbi:MAG: hypothetical protein IPJ61_20765 [Tessaracoccus sp.]|uniref:hypothetical protein n=1 Tax=Tessaracoccus sp. TaxID=1971211 RepID=UPI001ED3C6F6|nr:hypothetical protein [Tessaracoccus sp.]MBK7823422.1 hypothetical protein [Tessaracoccus sp.]